MQVVTKTVNMLATSGVTTLTFSNFNSIDAVISVYLKDKNKAGTAADVYQVGSPVGNQVGVSLDGADGMTLTVAGTAMGK